MKLEAEVIRTSAGYMAYDHDCDEYLCDEHGDNCFDTYVQAQQLVTDLLATRQEHKEAP